MNGRAFAAVAALVVMAAAGIAGAHGRSVSYSAWAFDAAGADVRVRISRLELTRLGLDPTASSQASDAVGRLFVDELRFTSGGEPCRPAGRAAPLPADAGWVVFGWRLVCGTSGDRVITSGLLLDVAPSHLHFARVTSADETALRVLSEAEPSWTLAQSDVTVRPDAIGSSLRDYLELGVEHILSGWDHLAFILALLLLASTFAEVATLVTSFTLAHSVTLGLAVLGIVRPEARSIEALIAFSIALVAAENAWILGGRGRGVPMITTAALVLLAIVGAGVVPRGVYLGLALFVACHFALIARSSRPARLRIAIAFAFGLIHGFGFAGVLAEMDLPTDRLVPALVGFNLGVEAGQLAVVALVWPALRFAAQHLDPRAFRWTVELASAAICGLGLFWFLLRGFA